MCERCGRKVFISGSRGVSGVRSSEAVICEASRFSALAGGQELKWILSEVPGVSRWLDGGERRGRGEAGPCASRHGVVRGVRPLCCGHPGVGSPCCAPG